MRELAFGIIVGTFSELRKEEQHRYHDIETKCFVCGVTKDDLEKDRINFKKHCEKDHNIWNYIYYMITLKFSDPQDLNAINGHVLYQIDKKYTNWIPSHKTKRELAEKTNKPEEIDLDELNFDGDKYNEYNNEQIDLT